MIAAIKVRGSNKLKKEIKDTLAMLRLHRKMHCVILKDTPISKGMLKKVRNWITYGEINDDILKRLIEKRGRKPGNKRLTKEESQEIFDKIKKDEKIPETIKPVFRLSPPSKGFKKSIKQHYPNGELGYRKEEINKLLKRMI
jgi:large subunit ribosomal protein L30